MHLDRLVAGRGRRRDRCRPRPDAQRRLKRQRRNSQESSAAARLLGDERRAGGLEVEDPDHILVRGLVDHERRGGQEDLVEQPGPAQLLRSVCPPSQSGTARPTPRRAAAARARGPRDPADRPPASPAAWPPRPAWSARQLPGVVTTSGSMPGVVNARDARAARRPEIEYTTLRGWRGSPARSRNAKARGPARRSAVAGSAPAPAARAVSRRPLRRRRSSAGSAGAACRRCARAGGGRRRGWPAAGSSCAPRRRQATTPLAEATMTAKTHGRSGHGGGKPIGSQRAGSGRLGAEGVPRLAVEVPVDQRGVEAATPP